MTIAQNLILRYVGLSILVIILPLTYAFIRLNYFDYYLDTFFSVTYLAFLAIEIFSLLLFLFAIFSFLNHRNDKTKRKAYYFILSYLLVYMTFIIYFTTDGFTKNLIH